MSKEIVVMTAEKISKLTNYSIEEVAVVKANLARNVNDSELAYFLNVCKTVGLNPFNREVWCYKDNKNNLLIFAGRDGFLAKAQKSPRFDGIRSSEVCENDVFEMDIANNKITHTPNYKEPRGKIIGAYALVFRKDGEPTIEWAEDSVYNKGRFTWETHHAEMIKKVAETHALKKAFGISGIQAEYDFDVKNDVAVPIDTEIKELSTEEELVAGLQNDVNELIRNAEPQIKKKYLTKMMNESKERSLSVDWLNVLIDEIKEELKDV